MVNLLYYYHNHKLQNIFNKIKIFIVCSILGRPYIILVALFH